MAKGVSAGDSVTINYCSLRFSGDPDTERAFLDDYHRNALRQMRVAIVLAIVITAAFGLLDARIAPAARAKLWFIRFGLLCPFFLTVFLVSFLPRARRFMQSVIALGLFVFGLGNIAKIVIMPAAINYFATAGLLMTPMFSPTIRMRFLPATAASLAIVAAYEVAAFALVDTSISVLVGSNFFLITSVVIGMITSYQLELSARKNFIQQLELDRERRKADRLLQNILPLSIADRLKQEHRTIADGFSEVTVLFADIAGFTELAASRTPREVVGLLNDIFSEFDLLAENREVEKIKTIGDAYMAVAGLPDHRPDHAEAVAELALDMQDAMARRAILGSLPVTLRIGINTGPVVAGVIGMKKFIYDVWGDTVNTASRMESQGIAGAIHVTSETYAKLRHAYCFRQRGPVQIKGKGTMSTYLLIGRGAPEQT